MSPTRWRIDYQNDTGPDDDGFSEWWLVYLGELSFRADSLEDAEWLCGLLNAHAPNGKQGPTCTTG